MSTIRHLSLFGFIIVSLSQPLNGQVFQHSDAEKIIKDSKLVRLNPKNKNVEFIQLRDEVKVEDKDQTIWLGKSLKTSQKHSFKEVSRSTDRLGNTHYKYQLHYKILPVEGEVYTVHSRDGKITSANGEYIPGNDINVVPGLSEQMAFNAAVKYVHGTLYRWEKENSARPVGELVILPLDERYVLVYKFDIYALQPLSRQFIFIDANSGKVLKTLNRIQDENVVGTAETMFSGKVNITTDFYAGHYRLREVGRGNGIETFDLNNATDASQAIDFTDADNIWNTSTNFDNAAYDAHYGSEVTYDYYYQKLNRNSYDDLGAKLTSYVHYGINFNNAFWDGDAMNYGDGDNISYRPFTGLEIVAHELTHALTQHTAGLIYAGESGALNESFSDIIGITIDFYAHPSTANYKMGDVVSLTGAPFRDLSNPNARGDPDTYNGLYWNGKDVVHCNSGVQNFWYYLLCDGGSGRNDLGMIYNVNGIGRDKAIQIAYRNLTVYLGPNSDFSDARFYSIQSAKDLYGDCSTEAVATAAAWQAVGIGDANDCYSPENFKATQVSRSQVALSWKKNSGNNDVLIAFSTSRDLGNPVDGIIYLPGSEIPGGGKVLYTGNGLSFTHSGILPGSVTHYKAWSVKSGHAYSGGVSASTNPLTINAGEDQNIDLSKMTRTRLLGQYEESIPYDSLTIKWEKINGRGRTIFDHPDSLGTHVSFETPGIYTFRLSVKYFGLESIDTLNVVVSFDEAISKIIFDGYHNWMGMDINGSHAYFADLKYGLRIIDISEISNPRTVSFADLFNCKYIHVSGNYAYVSQNFGGGLSIYDIKDKLNPIRVGYFDIPNSTENEDFILENGIVYFTSIPGGLYILDVTNPAAPIKIGLFPCSPINIEKSDNYLYVTERMGTGEHLRPFVLDVANPANPIKLADFPRFDAEYLAADAIQGEYFYRCETDANLETGRFNIYNISDRVNPVRVGSTDISWNDATVAIQGNYAYLGDGLRVIDITDKAHPTEVSNAFVHSFNKLSVNKNIVYGTREETFSIYKPYLENTPPYVYAGIDKKIDSIKSIIHAGVFDDGRPLDKNIISTWSKTSGPGNASFSDVNNINPTVSFSDTGKYIIRLTASDGELSAYDEVQLYVHFAISKQPVKQNVCENEDVEFSVGVKSKTSVTYKWYKNNVPLDDLVNIEGINTARLIIHNAKIQDAGNYYCLISNGKSFKSNVAELSVNQLPGTPLITFDTGVLHSNATNGNQWYLDNQPLQNAVNQTLIPQSDGDYFVIVTLDNCSSGESNVISCISTGTKDAVAGNGITMYPNPTADIISVVINNKFESDFIVDVYDNTGILLKTLKKSESETHFDVDLTNFSAGFFVILVHNTNRSYLTKVLKR